MSYFVALNTIFASNLARDPKSLTTCNLYCNQLPNKFSQIFDTQFIRHVSKPIHP
jgi:hypothetical protein